MAEGRVVQGSLEIQGTLVVGSGGAGKYYEVPLAANGSSGDSIPINHNQNVEMPGITAYKNVGSYYSPQWDLAVPGTDYSGTYVNSNNWTITNLLGTAQTYRVRIS